MDGKGTARVVRSVIDVPEGRRPLPVVTPDVDVDGGGYRR
jgi:hypothetical protein